jgi:hypothetical protein
MYVVLYNPGAGGNMVSAVIDSTDYILGNTDMWLWSGSLRQRLVTTAFKENINQIELKPDNANVTNVDIQQKRLQDALDEIDVIKKYTCISSHYFYYFTEKTNYKIILIDDSEDEISKWTLDRAIKHGHGKDDPMQSLVERKNNINQCKKLMYEDRVKTIDMRDILSGKLITILQEFIDTPLNEQLYESWLHNNIK